MFPHRKGSQNVWWKIGRNSMKAKGSEGPVGTEAVAIKNIELNKKNFCYPPNGFQTCIEYSLLYAMISEPKMYPEEAVNNEILDEDFFPYLIVAEKPSLIPRIQSKLREENEEEANISYAQLSAILGLSAEKNHDRNNKRVHESNFEGSQSSIFEKLCKKIIKCVIRYAENHNLDRENEVKELLRPVEKHSSRRLEKAVWKDILQTSFLYAASISTGSLPLVMAVAAAVTVAPEPLKEETKNIETFRSDVRRAAVVEHTSLLDENEDDYN